jgi:hypothetical protein
LEDKLDPRPRFGGLNIQRELDPQRKWLIAFKNERDGIESIIPKELLEELQKIESEEVKPEESGELGAEAPGAVLEEAPAVEPEAEAPGAVLEEAPADVDVLEEPGELQPEIPEPVEPVEEALKVETIEEVKQKTRSEIERFGRIKSPEAFDSVLKNMTDYVNFLEGDSKNKFVEFATRFVKNNLDLVGEAANGVPEDLRGKKIGEVPEEAKKDSWWTLIFFLLELGLATSETVVNEAVTAING